MSQSIAERAFSFLFTVSMLFLCFVAGTAASYIEPYRTLSLEALAAGQALYFKVADPPNLWFPSRFAHAGVITHNLAKSQDDLVLFTTNESKAYLMNRSGRIVHEWGLPFSAVWPKAAHILDPAPDGQIYWRRAHVFPNGDLLAIYEGIDMSPYGGGIVKIDRDSKLIWKWSASAHHDFDFDEDGNIYVLAHQYRSDALPGVESLKPPIIEDFVAVLSPEGRLLRKFSIPQAIARSSYSGLIDLMPTIRGDITHTNNLEILDAELAERFPMFEAGQIIVSILRLNTVAVIDPNEEKVVWALTGLTVRQHDPDFLPSGNILMFDNWGHSETAEGASRIIEINPETLEIVWRYAGTEEQPLFSENRGSQQRLPNGNTFITESTAGRLLEVTAQGEIVWEYITPRQSEDGERISILCSGMRLARDELAFLDD